MNLKIETSPTALVTGASSGIGEAYALALAKRATHHLLLSARRVDRLENLKQRIEKQWLASGCSLTVTILPADLSIGAEREALLRQVDQVTDNLQLLINNAGFGSLGEFADSELSWELQMVDLNIAAVVHLCRHFTPKFIAAKTGAIINVCSTAAFQPMPYMATYGATKGFLLQFSLALNAEVEGNNVLVLAHCPGPTESEFHVVVGLDKKISELPGMTAEEVVDQALRGLDCRRPIVINGKVNRALTILSRVIPPMWTARMVRRGLRGYLS